MDAGYQVTGSDTAAYPPMGDYLAGLGIEVMEGYRSDNLRDYDLVVVGNVIRATNPEAEYARAAALLAMRMVALEQAAQNKGDWKKATPYELRSEITATLAGALRLERKSRVEKAMMKSVAPVLSSTAPNNTNKNT